MKELLNNPGIIRNKLKIKALITNAQQFSKIQEEYGTFDQYIWSFVDYKPIINSWEKLIDIPTSTEISDMMSKALKKKGLKFVGTTICYAYMQAIGMVNDHLLDCPCRLKL
ncbi:MAG: DNA-3-methyladenine glycosylase I [Lachnotalea sp.]